MGKHEKKIDPLHNTDRTFKKGDVYNLDEAFDAENVTKDTKTKRKNLKKPKVFETGNAPSKDRMTVTDTQTGKTGKRKPRPRDVIMGVTLKVKNLGGGRLPTKAHPNDTGWDLYAARDVNLKNGTYPPITIPTRIAIEFPPNVWGQIEGRSGLASKGVFPVGGIIDSNYRGEIKVMLQFLGTSQFYHIKDGDKIAQLVLRENIPSTVEFVDELSDTDRGEDGFGSSDKG